MLPSTSNNALQSLTELSKELERSLKQIGYEKGTDTFDQVKFPEYTDPRDSEFVRDRIIQVLQTLDTISEDIMYLNQPVRTKGYLIKQKNGRFSLNDIELRSGMLVEILDDDFEWRLTRIEYGGEYASSFSHYYAVALGKNIALDSRECRIRV